jgi:Asp-tRNA(Asn)/Glu-tRNA(Gln) amidotransferase A subunit family amidase
MSDTQSVPEPEFCLEEATIDELHQAITSGRTTCAAVVQQYIDRVRAHNGVASMLVTKDGGTIPEAAGTMRAGAPLRFPTRTAKASDILPDLDKYQGPAAGIRPYGADCV